MIFIFNAQPPFCFSNMAFVLPEPVHMWLCRYLVCISLTVSTDKVEVRGQQRGAGDPPSLREKVQLHWVDLWLNCTGLCVMSSRLMLRLTGLPSRWIYSQPEHAESCVLSFFRATGEKQVSSVCFLVCISARQQQLQEGKSSGPALGTVHV